MAALAGSDGRLAFGVIAGLRRLCGPTTLIAHWEAVLAAIIVLCATAAIITRYVLLERSHAQLATANANYATVNADYQTTLAENRELSSAQCLQSI